MTAWRWNSFYILFGKSDSKRETPKRAVDLKKGIERMHEFLHTGFRME